MAFMNLLDWSVLERVLVVLALALFAFLLWTLWEKHLRQKQEVRLHHNLYDLEESIHQLDKKGLNEHEIIKKLRHAGWNKHLATLVYHEMHKPTHKIDKLHTYVRVALLTGKPKELILEQLVDMGWDEELVQLALQDEHPRPEDLDLIPVKKQPDPYQSVKV
jgi:hypothetical protein